MATSVILTEKEAAAMIVDTKAGTLAKWRLRRTGPAYLKLGGRVRYRAEDIEAWMDSCRINPTEQPAPKRKHTKRKKVA
jgi:predicted DNA-binding transcriptional regulator AlpA